MLETKEINVYTIGEFSKLSKVSSRMLRHYDAIGLLSPSRIGEDNGYRYYDPAQIPILFMIERLKEYGFQLAEIKELLVLSEKELSNRIHVQNIKLYQEMNQMRKTLRQMETDVIKMEGMNMLQEKYHIITMNIPKQTVFGIRKKIDIGQTHDLFMELHKEIEKRGLKQAGVTQLLYLGTEFSYEDMDVEAQIQVTGEDEGIKEVPEMFCAAVTHVGPYNTSRYAYEALGAWMVEHPEYEVCAPAIERYIKDEGMVDNEEELETGILFPIKKVE